METDGNHTRGHGAAGPSNRAFGGVFVVVFLMVACAPLLHGGRIRGWSMLAALLLVVITIAAPGLLTVPNRLWLRFGLFLHRFTTPIVLFVLFYGAVTPMGVLMRLCGRDSMRIRHRDAASYWISRQPPGPKPDSLTNQF